MVRQLQNKKKTRSSYGLSSLPKQSTGGIAKATTGTKRRTTKSIPTGLGSTSTTSNTTDDIYTFCNDNEITIHKPGELHYERAVAHSNLIYRFSRPQFVIQPADRNEVQKVVIAARARKILLTIKNGGHSYSGSSTTDIGILLDLTKMDKVHLDIQKGIMALEAGAQWGHAYKELINGHHDGYVVNGGRCPNVGVSGYLLGGGLGPFGRSLGLGCDDLIQVTLVTADGEFVTVGEADSPNSIRGRLFWALRGAGAANFGVVVELVMRVRKLHSADGVVVAGRYTWHPEPEEKDYILETMNHFYTHNWSRQMTIDSTWVSDLKDQGGEISIRFLVYYDGHDGHQFDKQINQGVINMDVAHQITRRVMPEKSTRFIHETLVRLWDEETKTSLPTQSSYRIFSSFIFKNDKETFERVTHIVKKELESFRVKFKGDQGIARISFIHSGGKTAEIDGSATAFRWRDGVYHAYIQMEWDDKWLEKDMRAFCKEFKDRLRPFSLDKFAASINFADASLPAPLHEKAYFGDNRQKLQQVKKTWDKNNYFNWAQGISLPAKDLLDPAEEDSDGELSVDEEALTDAIATRQWERQTFPQSERNEWLGKHEMDWFWWLDLSYMEQGDAGFL